MFRYALVASSALAAFGLGLFRSWEALPICFTISLGLYALLFRRVHRSNPGSPRTEQIHTESRPTAHADRGTAGLRVVKAADRFTAELLVGRRPMADARWWNLIPRLVGQMVLGIISNGWWFKFEPSCTVLVLDRQTGSELIRHRWGNCDVARRDLELIESALTTMSIEGFCREWGFAAPPASN